MNTIPKRAIDAVRAAVEAREVRSTSDQRIQALVRNVGAPGRCSLCRTRIYWMLHQDGKRFQYDYDGQFHTDTCPKLAEIH